MAESLEQINAQLKSLKIGVRIWQRGDRLWLQATLPPKPGSDRSHPYQQGIALGIYANPAGLKRAKAEAITLGGLLACKAFSWEPYLKSEPASEPVVTPKSTQDWVREFEDYYFSSRDRNAKTLTTWDKDYRLTFTKLPQKSPLTPELILKAIAITKPNTKSRKRYCMALGALVRFAGLDLDLRHLSGNYSPTKAAARDLPEEDLIVQIRDRISNPAWQWAYGILAVYGLRPHEIFHLDLDRLARRDKVLRVLDGKTGNRICFPFPPQWWEQWELWNIALPSVTADSNAHYGQRVSQYFKRNQIGFNPYDLRHAWAVRTLRLGLDITLAAQQMGHSVAIHSQVYHRWISEKTHQEAYDKLIFS